MDTDINTVREELEANIQEIYREMKEAGDRFDQKFIDSRSYENRMLFLKKQLSKAQKELDEL